MTLAITSPQNPRIREVVRLRDRRGRQNQSRFIIDGLREIQRACATSLIIEELTPGFRLHVVVVRDCWLSSPGP